MSFNSPFIPGTTWAIGGTGRPKINLPGVAIKYTRGNGLFFITAI